MDNRESVGVVSAPYFVGRAQLLEWINTLSQLNYTRIEQTASGVFACHVFDALYPGQIRFEKVKFNARQEYEYIHNYKILQACFNRVGMKRQIDVEKLIKGKYQDNLEFIQWVKGYYDSHVCDHALQYNGRARREEVRGRSSASASLPSRLVNSERPLPATTKSPSRQSDPNNNTKQSPSRPRPPLYGSQKAAQTSVGLGRAQITQLKQEIEQLKEENENQRLLIADLETEKDFYFNKLRRVELIIQSAGDYETDDSSEMFNILREGYSDIKDALYAEDDEALDIPSEGVAYEDAIDGGELAHDPQYHDGEGLARSNEEYDQTGSFAG